MNNKYSYLYTSKGRQRHCVVVPTFLVPDSGASSIAVSRRCLDKWTKTGHIYFI